MNIDQPLFHWIFGMSGQSPLLDAAAVLVARYVPYALVAGMVLFAILELRGSRPRLFFFLETSLTLILSRGLMTPVISFFYYHARPFELASITPLFTVSGPSFPSGHAAFFFALAATLFCFNRRWGWWYVLAAAAIGIARVFAGVHWPLDIAGGAVVGIVSASIVHALLRQAGMSVGAYPRPRDVA